MLQNFTKFGVQAAKTAAKFATESVANATATSKVAQDYEIGELLASAGPNGIWKIYRATSRKVTYRGQRGSQHVSVWIIEKSSLQEGSKAGSKGNPFKAFQDLIAADIKQASRLKHPGVIKILEPLEDARTQFLFVTEEIACSLHNFLNNWGNIAQLVRKDMQDIIISELEMKQGLSEVSETLAFMHTSQLAHCNVSPESIIITPDGAWKLAGLGFVSKISPDIGGSDPWNVATPTEPYRNPTYYYDNPYASHSERLVRPNLQYTAPELVSGGPTTANVNGAADVFSLGCVMYEALTQQQLLTALDASEYRGVFQSMHMVPFNDIPATLQSTLRQMLSDVPTQRPPAASIPAVPYFQADMLLRALRFITTMIQRDAAQKHAFIRDMPNFWQRFDKRLLRLRVLPALLQEWQSEAMRNAVLPLVLAMAQEIPASHFQAQILPQLRTIMQGAQGPQLLEIIRSIPNLQMLMRIDQVEDTIVPMLMQALETGDTHLQEEALKALPPVVEKVNTHCLQDRVLASLYKVTLNTKSAGVRGQALRNLAISAPRLTPKDGDQLLQMLVQVTKVDRTSSTIMRTIQVCNALAKDRSAEYVANRILPMLMPLLVAESLTPEAFSTFLGHIRDLLSHIESRRTSNTKSNSESAASQWDSDLQTPPLAVHVPTPLSPSTAAASANLSSWQSPGTSNTQNDWGWGSATTPVDAAPMSTHGISMTPATDRSHGRGAPMNAKGTNAGVPNGTGRGGMGVKPGNQPMQGASMNSASRKNAPVPSMSTGNSLTDDLFSGLSMGVSPSTSVQHSVRSNGVNRVGGPPAAGSTGMHRNRVTNKTSATPAEQKQAPSSDPFENLFGSVLKSAEAPKPNAANKFDPFANLADGW